MCLLLQYVCVSKTSYHPKCLGHNFLSVPQSLFNILCTIFSHYQPVSMTAILSMHWLIQQLRCRF